MMSFISLVVLSVSLLCFVSATPINGTVSLRRALPTPVSAATARTYLKALTIEVESNSPAYERDFFHTWIIISGKCDTRETVLARDAISIVQASDCSATSGSWVSPYDGVPTTLPSDLDIDHLVPLKEAWVSGARTWTAAQREAFANDVTRPQLVAVTDNLNEAKGDKDPAEWMVPLQSYVCTYVRAWVTVKHYYALSVDQAEYDALTDYLADC
ncbi:hypothetical protein ARMSODRAFT_897162 [Armillaria solidipes]|uniref:GmrSD restriction endonucleases C-terminal domain-containing protein n=1 Tax=Armillaria solidipes TaxID=1076256 RepID=A0A2H3B570_9AGAR|nr:hypothetical protein ARMSODRAFT_897162 [Armillaria solidipes]